MKKTCFILLLLLAFGCAEKPSPSVVVILVDTLRADHLKAHGFPRDLTPNITRLGTQGVLFKNLMAASPWTGPSVVSIVTGKYPDQVGVRDLRDPMPESAITLSERFQSAGYATLAIISNAMAGPLYGHSQGYDSIVYKKYKGQEGDKKGRPVFTADQVTDEAIKLVKSAKEPFFLYAHYTDPHDPYLPPAEWLRNSLGESKPLDEELLMDGAFTQAVLDPDQIKKIKTYYETEIAFTDAEIGRLLKELPQNVWVVLVGDHGEEFLEHGGFLHGHTLYQELLHTPLIIKGPKVPKNKTVSVNISHVDVAPTLMDLAGFEPDPSITGKSLVPLFFSTSKEWEDRILYSILENKGFRCVASRKGPWKMLYTPKDKRSFLYHVERDRFEQNNLAAQEEKIASAFVKAITAREKSLVPALLEGDPQKIKAREEELRALGYIK